MNDLKKILIGGVVIGSFLSLEIANLVNLNNFRRSIKPYEGQYKEFTIAKDYCEKDRNFLEKAATDYSRGDARGIIRKWDKD